jgi:hypothetical protein
MPKAYVYSASRRTYIPRWCEDDTTETDAARISLQQEDRPARRSSSEEIWKIHTRTEPKVVNQEYHAVEGLFNKRIDGIRKKLYRVV